jgi:hypothetical protein
MKRFLVLAGAVAAAATVGCASTSPPPARQPAGLTGFPGTAGGMQQPTQNGMIQTGGMQQQPMQGGMTQPVGMMPQGGQTVAPSAMTGMGGH